MAFVEFIFSGRSAPRSLEIRINKECKATVSPGLVKAIGPKFNIMVDRPGGLVALVPSEKGRYTLSQKYVGSVASAAVTAAIAEVAGPVNAKRALIYGLTYAVAESESKPTSYVFRVRQAMA